jgi:hypothetical protein
MLKNFELDAEMSAVAKLLNAKPIIGKMDSVLTGSTATDSDEFEK